MKWTVKIGGGPQVVNHAGGVWKNWIFSIGGYNSLYPEEYAKCFPLLVYRLDINTLRWHQCPSPPVDLDMIDTNSYHSTSSVLCQRYGHTVVQYGDKFYMWGGRNNVSIFNALHCFNPETLEWSTIMTKGVCPPPSDGHSACVIDNKMYIFGGYEYYNEFYTNCVYFYDFKESKWGILYPSGDPPAPKDFHSAVAIGSKMYVYGGRSCENDDENIYDPDIKYFDTVTNSWHNVNAQGDIPEPRRSHSAWMFNGDMYIFGGYNEAIKKHYNDLYKFSPLTNTWMKLDVPGKIPEIRRRQVCVNVLDKVYLFGGSGPTTNKKIETIQVISDDEELLYDKDDLHILDYNPTLKILCMDVVLQHNLDTSCLPEVIRWDIETITTPNKITSTNS